VRVFVTGGTGFVGSAVVRGVQPTVRGRLTRARSQQVSDVDAPVTGVLTDGCAAAGPGRGSGRCRRC
jgi:nucleoside-diphosphate-sugar epimerase